MYAIRSYYVWSPKLCNSTESRAFCGLEPLMRSLSAGSVRATWYQPYLGWKGVCLFCLCHFVGRITSYNVCYTKLLRKLLAKFITVRNGGSEGLDIVAHGNERVLRARLSDAEFFFNEDRKIKLAERLEKLKTVVFQEGLGNIYDKSSYNFV